MRSKVSSVAKARQKTGTLIVKLGELIDSRQALQSLIAQPLPATVAFRLARLVQAINPEFTAYESTRVKLCQEHGKLDEETSRYKFLTARAQALFASGIGDLRASEVSVAGEKVQLSLLSAAKLSAAEMIQLQWLIVE